MRFNYACTEGVAPGGCETQGQIRHSLPKCYGEVEGFGLGLQRAGSQFTGETDGKANVCETIVCWAVYNNGTQRGLYQRDIARFLPVCHTSFVFTVGI